MRYVLRRSCLASTLKKYFFLCIFKQQTSVLSTRGEIVTGARRHPQLQGRDSTSNQGADDDVPVERDGDCNQRQE
ncbi:hypothetical protein EVAR_66453_1 [Eumeta japonica]|uniref:Uncharacterized protein n=1 Tax=Eumeta variegata TaxID=151549 RepID=A0A4C1ZXW5_EUMVA|nr:hypothetical protein EVAR_66453_1 [Eumeta japonica]